MTIIAFDVSKKELVGVRINRSAKLQENIIIENNKEDIEQFLGEAKIRYPHLTVSAEATAEYHRCLALCALELNIPFYLLNPLLTKQFTRSTIRKKKTDLTDALIIAKLTLQGEGTRLSFKSLDPLKSVNRTLIKTQKVSMLLQAMQSRYQRVFPEDGIVVSILAKPLEALKEAVTSLDKQIQTTVDPSLRNLLMSIPGIGPKLAATLITEIGDIEKFSSGKSLVAYAGLDPKVRQSGVSLKRNTKLTKRGSPYLRRAAYIAAYIAKRHDPELREYFEKKTSEGKRYKEATVATARKIIYRVYAVWKRKSPYLVDYPQTKT